MTGIHDSVETYEPKVDVTYEGSVPKVDNSFDDITDDNGNINIIINSEVIGQTLAKKIYTSWTSGLRELYNNEARACRTAKKMGGDPSIVITVDPNDSSRKIIIQGVDSLGITKAMFNKVLRVIGTSGNTDGEEIGQYGMGFISYALMCDALLMETWSRETDEHYAMLCDSGLKFKPIPLETTNGVNRMSEYGTKLTMTCNDDVSFSTLVSNVYKLARFSKVPTKIIIKSEIEGYSRHSWRNDDDDEDSYDAGVYECPSYQNGMDYMKDSHKYEWIKNSKKSQGRSIVTYKEVTIDNEDYRFDGIFVLTKSSYGTIDMSVESRKNPLFLVGTEIDSKLSIGCFHMFTMNVKNERKYSPVASRDSLENNAVDLLEEDINDKLTEYFQNEFPITTIKDYNSSLDKALLSRNVTWNMEKYLAKETNDISDTLNTRYGTTDKTYSQLSDMLAGGGNLVCLKSLRQNLMDLLSEHIDGNVTFFRMPTRLSDEERGHRVALFKDLNIIMGEDYKKDNKLKESGSGRSTIVDKNGKKTAFTNNRTCVLYNSTRGTEDTTLFGNARGWRSGSNKYSSTIGDINNNYHNHIIIADTKRFHDTEDCINELSNDWKVVHDMKGLSDKIMTIDKLVNKIGKKEYQTNKGIVKGSDLIGNYMAVVMSNKEQLLNIPDPDTDESDVSNYLFGVKNKTGLELRWIAIKNIEEYVALNMYLKFKPMGTSSNMVETVIHNDQYGQAFKTVLKNPISGDELSFNGNNSSSKDHKGDVIARMYWINDLLPKEYSDVFLSAVQYDMSIIDRIEIQSHRLMELLGRSQ